MEGFPIKRYNGVYTRVGEELHEGWPRYLNQQGDRHLFRYMGTNGTKDSWHLSNKYGPLDAACNGYIKSLGGEVPCGTNQWNGAVASKWGEYTVTILELVCYPLPSPP